MKRIMQIYLTYFLLITFNIIIVFSKFFDPIKKFVLPLTIVLYTLFVFIVYKFKIKNILFYLFVTAMFITSYLINVLDLFHSLIIVAILSLIMIIFSFVSKLKGIEGEIVGSTDKYSIVKVEPDVLLKIKPGYYIIEKSLPKGKKILIFGIDFFENNKITKFKEI